MKSNLGLVSRPWAFTAALAFVLLQTVAIGRPQSPQDSAPLIHTTTSEVLLDFVVRDKNARIIRDLKPGEVQVFEDGVPQTLRHFEFYDFRTEAQKPGAPGHSHPGTAETTSLSEPANGAPATPVTVNELRDMSMVSVVIANLDPRDRALTVDAMHEFVKNELKPNVYVGVYRFDMGGLRALQSYTNDGEKISAAVVEAATSARTGRFQGIGLQTALDDETPQTLAEGFYPGGAPGPTGPIAPYAMPASILDTSAAEGLGDAFQASIRILAPLHDLVGAQAQIPGRKVVLLFMSGLPMGDETVEMLHSLISAANRANVTIYAYNGGYYGTNDSGRKTLMAASNASMQQQLATVTGGDMSVTPTEAVALDQATQSIHANSAGNLADFAEATGGGLLHSSTDMRDALHGAMEGVRTHYELTYAPTNTSMDGSFRKIEVKVTRPGATVFSRNGYYALPIVHGQQIYPFEIATIKAINTTPDLHQFDFHTSTLQFRSGAVRNQLAFIFQAPTRDLTVTEDAQWAKVHVCVTALIKDGKGQIVDKISKDIPYDLPIATRAGMERGTVSFTAPFLLPPGHYTIDTAAVDRNSMKASVSRSVLDIEWDSGFSMSDATVARRIDAMKEPANAFDPLEARGGKITPDLEDVVTPDAKGNVNLYAVAYPPAPADSPVSVTIEIRQNNRVVMRSPASAVPLDADGAAPMLAALPVAKFEAGNYEADVQFEYKGERLMKKVNFTLAGSSVAANNQ